MSVTRQRNYNSVIDRLGYLSTERSQADVRSLRVALCQIHQKRGETTDN